MVAYLILLLAVLTRIIPLHTHSWNFVALGGGLLFFGSQMRTAGQPAWHTWTRLASALAILIAADYYLTTYVYQFPFHATAYLVTWTWYAAVCLLGMEILRKTTILRVTAGVLASATSFFLLSNFAVWAGSTMYPHSLAGLAACYTAALPFYRNDLVSTTLTASVLFGLPVLAARILESIHTAQNDNLPTA